MIIEPKYFIATIASFSDVIGDNGIVFGNEHWYMRELAEKLSQDCDNLIVLGNVNDLPSAAFFNGEELSVAYDSDLNESYYVFKRQQLYRLTEKTIGGFYLVEENLTTPIKFR